MLIYLLDIEMKNNIIKNKMIIVGFVVVLMLIKVKDFIYHSQIMENRLLLYLIPITVVLLFISINLKNLYVGIYFCIGVLDVVINVLARKDLLNYLSIFQFLMFIVLIFLMIKDKIIFKPTTNKAVETTATSLVFILWLAYLLGADKILK